LEDVEMIFKDYYKILDLEDKRVSLEEIKVAFREQAKKYHPDVNVGSTSAEERFKDINEAYKVLSNPVAKRKYDRMWNNYVGKKQAKAAYEESIRGKDSIFSDFFNMFFGYDSTKEEKVETYKKGNKKTPAKGDNIETEINVDIQEAFHGAEKKISLRAVNRENENI
jgi:curved DNA-binding protein